MNNHAPGATWTERVLKAVAIGAGVAAAFLLIWYGAQILLVVFAGVLLGLLLSGLAEWVHSLTHLSYRPAFFVVLASIVCLIGFTSWIFAGRVAEEADRLAEEVPAAAGELAESLKRYDWLRRILDDAPQPAELVKDQPQVVSKATGLLSSVFSGVAAGFVVLFIAVYTGFDPQLYRRGLVRLVPPSRRQRADEVMKRLGHTLRWWLVAHFSAMAVVGILTGIGLWLLGVPLAFGLALIAALLAFIPNIGPVLSAVPAILLALSNGPRQALYVALLYIGVQAVESNLITPIFELTTVSLPPALTISVQVLLGTIVGIVGRLVASPLCATAMVLIQMLYLEDKLGETGDRL